MKRIVGFLFILFLIVSPFILNVLRKNVYFSTSARVINLQSRVLELESEVEALQAEYYRITSPTYIESLARRMGFHLPDSSDFIILEVSTDKQ